MPGTMRPGTVPRNRDVSTSKISIAQNNQKSTGNFVIDENGNVAELYIAFDGDNNNWYYRYDGLFYASSEPKSFSNISSNTSKKVKIIMTNPYYVTKGTELFKASGNTQNIPKIPITDVIRV